MKTVSNETALTLLKWSEFFIYFLVVVPIIVILYQTRGITVGDFFLIQGMFRIASFFFEIPSGYLSDTFSRKKVLLIGSVIYFLSYAGLFFAYGFWEIAACEMGLGLAMALFSGTKESYAYDLMKRMGREKNFLKEYGSMNTYGQTASFIAVLVGGSLYALIGDWVIAIEAMAALCAIVCCLMLPELHEVRRKIAPESSPLKDIAGIVKTTVRHPEIKWFMMFPAIFGSFTLVLFWMLQPTMEMVGVAAALFGIFVGINQFSRIVFSKYAHKIYEIFGTKKIMYGCVGVIIIGTAIMLAILNTQNMWMIYLMLAIVAIIPATQKMCGLVFNTFIHHRIESKERGTVLSINQMYNTFFTGGIMILMKPLLDGFGIEWTLLIALLMFGFILIPLKKILDMKL